MPLDPGCLGICADLDKRPHVFEPGPSAGSNGMLDAVDERGWNGGAAAHRRAGAARPPSGAPRIRV